MASIKDGKVVYARDDGRPRLVDGRLMWQVVGEHGLVVHTFEPKARSEYYKRQEFAAGGEVYGSAAELLAIPVDRDRHIYLDKYYRQVLYLELPLTDTVMRQWLLVHDGELWVITRMDGTEILSVFRDAELGKAAQALLREKGLVDEQGWIHAWNDSLFPRDDGPESELLPDFRAIHVVDEQIKEALAAEGEKGSFCRVPCPYCPRPLRPEERSTPATPATRTEPEHAKNYRGGYTYTYDTRPNGYGGHRSVNAVLHHEERGIHERITSGFGTFVSFPGVVHGDWEDDLVRPFSPKVEFWSNIEAHVDGSLYYYWTVQPDGEYWADGDGFGMRRDVEITLVARIGPDCRFAEPFHLA